MRTATLILGITGSIASGKSLVAAAFAKHGAALVSADLLAREVVAPGSEGLKRLVVRFGPAILSSDGSLDRERLARIVFVDSKARAALEKITHPAIARLAEERLAAHVASGIPLVVYEAPLLFEVGAESRVDRVLVVRIAPEEQLRRLMQRDGLDRAAAQQRVTAQMSQEEKLARADYVIDNSAGVAATLEQVDRLWQRLTGEGA